MNQESETQPDAMSVLGNIVSRMTINEVFGESPATPYLVSRYPGPSIGGVSSALLYHHARMEWGVELQDADGIRIQWTGVIAKRIGSQK